MADFLESKTNAMGPVLALNDEVVLATEAHLRLPSLFPTSGRVQWAIRNRDHNGLKTVFRCVGGRWYVHIPSLRKAFETSV